MEYRQAIAHLSAALGRPLQPGAAGWIVEWCEGRAAKLAHEGGFYSDEWTDAPSGEVAVDELMKRIKAEKLPDEIRVDGLEKLAEVLNSSTFLCQPD